MKISKSSKIDRWLLLAMMSLSLAGQAGISWAQQVIIKADGSSTVFPITEAVSEEFQKEKKGAVQVTVGISGTGGGFKRFCRGETDISNASRPILQKEMAACRETGVQYYEIPVAFDALTVMVNLKNDWVSSLSIEDLKKVWEPLASGKITQWNQIRPEWPKKALKLYGPGADSGTFDYFTEAVVGKAKASRGDYSASEDDNVLVQGISNDQGALGYFGYAYYQENQDKLKAVAIKAPGAKPVLPSTESVENGSYQPLSRPIFIYVNKKAAKRAEVKEYVEFYLKHAAALSAEVGYIALPEDAYQKALEKFQTGKVGTVFGGKPEVGISIQNLLGRKTKI